MCKRSIILGIFLSLITFSVSVSADETAISQEINRLITARHHPYLKQSDFSNRAEDLDVLYKGSNYGLLWLGHDNSAKNIADALDLLSASDQQGLDADDYDLSSLREKYAATLALSPDDSLKLASYDTALSIAMLRFMHDLHYGRVNPQGINFNLKLRDKKTVDLPTLLKDSVSLNTVAQLPVLVEPKLEQYKKLKAALSIYRGFAEKDNTFKFMATGKLKPGQAHSQLNELRDFLMQLGDLSKDAAISAENAKKPVYTNELVEGVKNFQRRHGIPANGVISTETVAALNEPVTNRVSQIQLAMERLRWLPELNVGRFIVVNIPAYQLWAIDGLDQGIPSITNMRVVVGKALKNQTPVLMANMSYVEFQPYWNVPPNILKEEILPKLARSPRFLDSQNMEIVAGKSNGAKPISLNAEAFEKLKKGVYRVRQRPGKRNSLGKVKFIFPNKDDVYLHDTPANALFSRIRRDFSHGCVRVENPRLLAEFVLKNQGKWTEQTIKKAMKSDINQRVDLKSPIPVLFFYTTVFADENNNINFYPDIYGHDQVLIEALRKPGDISDQVLFVTTTDVPAPTNVNP